MVLLRKPVATAPAHRGMAMPKFIDNCVVGVNEWGNRPSRLVVPINRIRDISIRVHVCPLVLWMFIICFDMSWSVHCCREMRRLFVSRLDVGNSRLGSITIRITRGRPKNVGMMKEANRFSFILFLRGCVVYVFQLELVLGCGRNYVLRFLAGVQ